MREARYLPPAVIDMIHAFPPRAHPMELLQSVISYLSGFHEHFIEHSATCNCRQTLHQIAQLTSVVAAYGRLRDGKEYVQPRQDLSHGANFLYMLHNREPDPLEGQIMDRSLVLHAEHGFNASTFTARVVASTLSTCYCSISSAIGALYGSLHGGANERVIEQVEGIGAKEKVEAWVDDALSQKRKIMGMGHRVYKVKDPRAKIMEQDLAELAALKNDRRLLDMLKELERVARDRMEAAGKAIYPNVDFFSGAVYRMLGIPPVLFTPIFAMARAPGWLAHILDQRRDNRLYRPRSLYVGPAPRDFVSIDDR
jgi:citrate synthase